MWWICRSGGLGSSTNPLWLQLRRHKIHPQLGGKQLQECFVISCLSFPLGIYLRQLLKAGLDGRLFFPLHLLILLLLVVLELLVLLKLLPLSPVVSWEVHSHTLGRPADCLNYSLNNQQMFNKLVEIFYLFMIPWYCGTNLNIHIPRLAQLALHSLAIDVIREELPGQGLRHLGDDRLVVLSRHVGKRQVNQ